MNDALCLMSDGIENRFLLLLMHFTFEYLHLAAPDRLCREAQGQPKPASRSGENIDDLTRFDKKEHQDPI